MTELAVFWGLVFADQCNDVGFLCAVLFLTQLFVGRCWVCARPLWRKGQFWRAWRRVHLVLILPDLHKHSQSAAAERPSVLQGVTLIHLSHTHQHHSLLFTHFTLSPHVFFPFRFISLPTCTMSSHSSCYSSLHGQTQWQNMIFENLIKINLIFLKRCTRDWVVCGLLPCFIFSFEAFNIQIMMRTFVQSDSFIFVVEDFISPWISIVFSENTFIRQH